MSALTWDHSQSRALACFLNICAYEGYPKARRVAETQFPSVEACGPTMYFSCNRISWPGRRKVLTLSIKQSPIHWCPSRVRAWLMAHQIASGSGALGRVFSILSAHASFEADIGRPDSLLAESGPTAPSIFILRVGCSPSKNRHSKCLTVVESRSLPL